MSSPQTRKIVLGILALCTAGFALYYFYFSNPEAISLGDLTSPSIGEPVGADILNLVDKIGKINIDPEVFSSPLFTRLQDLSAVIGSEQQIRPNPFAPLGSDNFAGTIQSTIRTSVNNESEGI